MPKILALKPDLVLAFSDLQADIVAELIRANVAVHAFNQRDVAGIFDMIRTLGALVGSPDKADALANSLAARVNAVHERAMRLPRRPRVYFGGNDDPVFTSAYKAGTDRGRRRRRGVFPANSPRAEERTVHRSRAPTIMRGPISLSPQCRRYRASVVAALARRSLFQVPRSGRHRLGCAEIKIGISISKSRPTDGLDALAGIIAGWVESRPG